MKNLWPIPAALVLLVSSAYAQSTVPTPRPTPPDDQEVVRISTNLIQLDVTVTDKKGNPVTDLRQDEIEIFENGKKKEITNFSFVSGTRVTKEEAKRREKERAKMPVLPSGPIRPESIRRTVAIVVDDLHLSFASSFWVKEALKKYIEEQVQEGDLVAIIRTSSGAGALQQFTTDRRQMLAAAKRSKFNLRSSGVSIFAPVRSGLIENETITDLDPAPGQSDIFARGTFGALHYVIRGLRELPGKKSVMLLSDGFPLDYRDVKGMLSPSPVRNELRQLIDFANRSSVSIYTIEAAGLVAPMITAADDLTNISLPGGERLTDGIIKGRLDEVNARQDVLTLLGKHTGGFAIINSNDIPRGMRRVMDDQSYYLVAYEPDEATFDPKKIRYNEFDIKVKRPGARVRYRSGFLSVSEEQRIPPKLNVTDQIIEAITSPFSVNGIDIRMNALFAADAKRNAMVNSFINIDPAGLTFTPAAGDMTKTSFDIVAFTFGVNGEVIDERSKNFTVTVTREQHQIMLERGLVTVFSLPIKKSGGYQVRLAVRDAGTGKLGSANQFIEVPSVKSGKLLLSGIVLGSGQTDELTEDAIVSGENDPLRYTSLRQFAVRSPLHFSYYVYNPKLGSDRKPQLIQSYRLYKDNQLVFTSTARQVPIDAMPSSRAAAVSGGLILGDDLVPGDYILQVDIRDEIAKRSATQFAQFEIVR
jgi:VWFA-related protein